VGLLLDLHLLEHVVEVHVRNIGGLGLVARRGPVLLGL